MADVKISPEVMDILERSTITGNSLQLPAGQLGRDLYVEVNKVLELSGGKWNRSDKAHIFSCDPRKSLGMAMKSGVAIDEKKLFQAFYTPKDLAMRVAEMADVEGYSVLEPSAGLGALADACMAQGAKSVHCMELNKDTVLLLRKKFSDAVEADFLKETPRPYQRIVMNPPFTKNQDVKHVSHALKFLDKGGVLVAIMAGNTSRKQFQDLLVGLDYEIEEVEEGAFKESGTNVRTIILKVRK